MPSVSEASPLRVIPAKAGIQKEMDPHFHGDDKKAVIPAKAGIQSIYKEEWIPFYKGMTEENPGSPIRSGMTIYFPD
jgi:hypothetical protein